MLHDVDVLEKGRSIEFRVKPGRGGRRRSVARHVLDGGTRKIKNLSRLLLRCGGRSRVVVYACLSGAIEILPADTASVVYARDRLYFREVVWAHMRTVAQVVYHTGGA